MRRRRRRPVAVEPPATGATPWRDYREEVAALSPAQFDARSGVLEQKRRDGTITDAELAERSAIRSRRVPAVDPALIS